MKVDRGVVLKREVEVLSKAVLRRFTAEYKRQIGRPTVIGPEPGEIGALLRCEELYQSHPSAWRAARERGELAGLRPKRRGPKAKLADPRDKRPTRAAAPASRCL